MNLTEINLEEGMPPREEAMDRLRASIKLAKQSKYKCAIIIHGYGSSGKGGIIRIMARRWLNAQVQNGRLKAVVNGEDFNVLNEKARTMKAKCPELNSLFYCFNHGVTVVEL